jgi:hypothetical protein
MHSLRQSRPGAPKWQRSSAAAVGLGLLLLVTGLLGSAAACGAGPTSPDRFIYARDRRVARSTSIGTSTVTDHHGHPRTRTRR